MKYDLVVMNPPYQLLKEGNKKSQAIWDKFVIKTLQSTLVKDGYLVAVHPNGWRNLGKMFDVVKKMLKLKQMLYLEVHNSDDGKKTFGVSTTYDFYCLKNTENLYNFNTKIKCMDSTIEIVDISKMNFIPNGMYDSFDKLISKNNNLTVNILYSESAYAHRKKHISKEQTDEFKYPVVYLTYKDASIKFIYSNINTNGHFGIPKVIWSNGISAPIVDVNGEYGLSEYSFAIIDEPKNLERIKEAMLTPEFIKLMSFSDGMTGHRYNYKVISLFRKDFWVDFLK